MINPAHASSPTLHTHCKVVYDKYSSCDRTCTWSRQGGNGQFKTSVFLTENKQASIHALDKFTTSTVTMAEYYTADS